MGCGLSKGDLTAVQDGTNMSAAEVKEAYKGFKQENKSDKIDLAKFTKLVASMNTNKGRACTQHFHLENFSTCQNSVVITCMGLF